MNSLLNNLKIKRRLYLIGYCESGRCNCYESKGWKDSTGRAVKNWKGKVRSVWCRDENKISQEDFFKPKIH